ncbi:hypothetical protein [Croceicoccus pelagius]|nr:hypothetical protein [Croceicoccus pelagius]
MARLLRPYFDFPYVVERLNRDFSQELCASYDDGGHLHPPAAAMRTAAPNKDRSVIRHDYRYWAQATSLREIVPFAPYGRGDGFWDANSADRNSRTCSTSPTTSPSASNTYAPDLALRMHSGGQNPKYP